MNNRDMNATTQKVITSGACFLSKVCPRATLGVLAVFNYKLLPPPPFHIR